MDNILIPKGVQRTSFWKFLLWLVPWSLLGLWGLYAAGLLLLQGLHHTGMDNRFAFGVWIVFDLAVIGLGAGAFFLGFLAYILKMKEIKEVLNTAVVVGFICYSGAVVTLGVDVGQPIRAWFAFWHANVHSMLTEVTFCITCYLTVLAIEYVPIMLKNPQLKKIPFFLVLEFNMHKIMAVFAGIGAFLSFFHQGSLGGMFGVMYGRPFAFRDGIGIWPSTFFLFILSAIAAGPSFIMLISMTVAKISGKKLVRQEVFSKLGRLSGILLAVYFVAKLTDTLIWIFHTMPASGFGFADMYRHQPYGVWVLVVELALVLIPAAMLLHRKMCEKTGWLVAGGLTACAALIFNRYIVTLQAQSVPTMSFDQFVMYAPTWQELALIAAVIGYGVILYSVSFRYLPLFPREREMQMVAPGSEDK